MSRTFSYLPQSPPREGEHLDLDLAYTIEAYFTDRDQCGDEGRLDNGDLLGEDMIPFLRGVMLATEDDDIGDSAKKLIKAIETHGAVIVKVHR